MAIDHPFERESRWFVWVMLLLNVPSFAALLITVAALVQPNALVLALVPLLYVYAPVGFVLALLIAALIRTLMVGCWNRVFR